MSYSLSISGHVNDDEQAAKADELIAAKGAEMVAAIREAGIPIENATFSGPSTFVNYLLPDPAPEAEADDSSA